MVHLRSERTKTVGAVLLLLASVWVAGCSPSDPDPIDRDANAPRIHERQALQMGTRFHVQLVAEDLTRAEQALDAAFSEVDRVEGLLSEWRDTSEISAVNRAAGEAAVAVGPELFHVVERSLHFSDRTNGAFDITFAGCGRLWSFKQPRLPDPDDVQNCLKSVDYRAIELNQERSTIRLASVDTRIGIAGIGKGFGVDRAAEVLEAHGITDYIIDGGGDIRLLGKKIDRAWSVGIAHPRQPGTLLGRLQLDRGAIVTSGDYQRSFERDGQRYHHILDPTTGFPARRSIAVTVIAANATDADALATGLFVLGPNAGLELVDRLPEVEALIVAPDGSIHRSNGFPLQD